MIKAIYFNDEKFVDNLKYTCLIHNLELQDFVTTAIEHELNLMNIELIEADVTLKQCYSVLEKLMFSGYDVSMLCSLFCHAYDHPYIHNGRCSQYGLVFHPRNDINVDEDDE